MLHLFRLAVMLGGIGYCASPALGHYNMLMPENSSVKRGDPVAFVYRWGHPFEHQIFDAPEPESVLVVAPDGKKTDLTRTVTKLPELPPTAYGFRYTPNQRGDFLFLLKTPPIWMDEEQEFFQDTVKVVLHVQAQKGWEAATGAAFELLPLTRPYGLQAGMVFQAQVSQAEGGGGSAVSARNPAGGTLVEVERYNPTPPKTLPPDEEITRTVKTDANGVVTCSLMEPGWWCLTAQRDGGTREHEGKQHPLRQRSTLWVFVDDKPAP